MERPYIPTARRGAQVSGGWEDRLKIETDWAPLVRRLRRGYVGGIARSPAGATASRSVREAEAEREQRIVTPVAAVDRDLRRGARPGVGELARRPVVAEQHVGHAVPLGAREPGVADVLFGNYRPTGKLPY